MTMNKLAALIMALLAMAVYVILTGNMTLVQIFFAVFKVQ